MVYTGSNIHDCKLGVYSVYWKSDDGESGGTSVAAIGQTYNGTRWLAPANWTGEGKFTAHNITDEFINKSIEKIELIACR